MTHRCSHAPAALLALAGLCSCDRPPAPKPPAAPPAAALPPAPTPNLDEAARLFARIPAERFALAGMNLMPTSAGFKFSEDAPPDSREVLLAILDELKPVIADAVSLSKKPLEKFPPSPEISEADPDAHMRHPKAHLQNLSRLLLTDAARAVDAQDADAALERLAAVARFARGMLAQDETLVRLAGATIAAQASLRLTALAADRPEVFAKARPQAVDELRTTLAPIDPDDPAGMIANWEHDARQALAECRASYTGQEGPARYADYLRRWGVESSLSGLALGDPLDWVLPTKDFAEQAAKLRPRDLAAALDKAEAAIPALAASVKARDLAAVRQAMIPVRDDPTQISRLVLAGAPSALSTGRALSAPIAKAKAAVSPTASPPK